MSGKWTAQDSGIGAGVDSYFEYLLKGGILFGIPRLVNMFRGKQKFKLLHCERGRRGRVLVWRRMML